MRKIFSRSVSLVLSLLMLFMFIVGDFPTKVEAATDSTSVIRISCDDEYELYLNGTLLGKGTDWKQSGTYNLNLKTGKNVIAVKAHDTGIYSGLLAEVEAGDAYLTSDRNWRASATAPSNWLSESFDDSSWSNSNDFGRYGAYPWNKSVVNFPADSAAHWIWLGASNYPAQYSTVYFRYVINVSTDAESGTTIGANDVVTSTEKFSSVEYQKKATTKDMPAYLSSRLYETMPESGSFTIPSSEISALPSVGDMFLYTGSAIQRAIKITGITQSGTNQVISYLMPELDEVFEYCDIPLQEVELTEKNFVPLENSASPSLKAAALNSSAVTAKGSSPVTYRRENGVHIIEFDKVLFNEQQGGFSSNARVTGKLELMAPKVGGQWKRKNYDLYFKAGEKATVKLTGDVKFKKEVKVPLYGVNIDAGVGKATVGIFLVVGVDGSITFECVMNQEYSIKAGVKGKCFFYIPKSINPYSEVTKNFSLTYKIDGKLTAWAGVQPEVAIQILGKEMVGIRIFGGIEGGCTLTIVPGSVNAHLTVDALLKGTVNVYKLVNNKKIFEVRWNLVDKTWKSETTPPNPSNMVAAWSFANGSAADSSGNNNNGTLVGNPTVITGKKDQALSFNGSNYMQVPNSSTINFGKGDFTISMWVKSATGAGTLIDKRTASDIGYHVILYGGLPLLQMTDTSGIYNYYGGTSKINDNNWHHLVISVDRDNASGLKFYIDGALTYTANPTTRQGSLDNTANLLIARHKSGSNATCSLDEIKFFNRALTADEASTLYKQ